MLVARPHWIVTWWSHFDLSSRVVGTLFGSRLIAILQRWHIAEIHQQILAWVRHPPPPWAYYFATMLLWHLRGGVRWSSQRCIKLLQKLPPSHVSSSSSSSSSSTSSSSSSSSLPHMGHAILPRTRAWKEPHIKIWIKFENSQAKLEACLPIRYLPRQKWEQLKGAQCSTKLTCIWAQIFASL